MAKAWREAASLILAKAAKVKDNTKKSLFDYELLMLQRSSKSKFMPNAFVFPGGTISSPSDLRSEWSPLFKSYSPQNRNLDDLVLRGVPRPLLISSDDDNDDGVPRDVGFRICAIRETFEESGIFLRTKNEKIDENVLKNWREKVTKDPESFLKMCFELEVVPDVWSLYEWNAWLTPTSSHFIKQGGRRFDTIFYLTVVLENEIEEAPSQDDSEIVNLDWMDPGTIVRKLYDKELWIAPPQLYEITRLINFRELKKLRVFASRRSYLGCTSTLPVFAECREGIFSLLPGDEDYPEDPNYFEETNHQPFDRKDRFKEIMKYTWNMNRMFIDGSEKHHIFPFVNITEPHGHKNPVKTLKHQLYVDS